MILVVAVVGGALQLLVPLHLASLGLDRAGIGLVYSVGAILGGAVVVITARVGDRVGRVPLAAGPARRSRCSSRSSRCRSGSAMFVVLVIAASGVQSILYAVGYPLSTDGADRAQLGHGVVLGARQPDVGHRRGRRPAGRLAPRRLAGDARVLRAARARLRGDRPGLRTRRSARRPAALAARPGFSIWKIVVIIEWSWRSSIRA